MIAVMMSRMDQQGAHFILTKDREVRSVSERVWRKWWHTKSWQALVDLDVVCGFQITTELLRNGWWHKGLGRALWHTRVTGTGDDEKTVLWTLHCAEDYAQAKAMHHHAVKTLRSALAIDEG